MTTIISGTSGLTFPDNSTQAVGFYGFKNRIINGAMVIDQRNAGASVTPTDGQFSVDRWKCRLAQASKYSIQQRNGTDTGASNYEAGSAPVGFKNSMKVTSLSAYSITSTDYFFLTQQIEGLNAYDLGWGTASAQPITISFWVKSSLTGTFGGALRAGGSTRSYAFSYTINTANTWEQKSITIAGDTSGTWVSDTSEWGQVDFGLGVGSTLSGTTGSWASATYLSSTGATSVVGTNAATFYITGVQLEKGSTATSFDYRPYGTELALCQRYYQTYTNIPVPYNANGNNGNNGWLSLVYPVVMRSAPTATASTGSYKQSATSITMNSITSISTNAGFLDQLFATGASNPGYSVPTIAYFGSLALSAEL